MNPRDMKGEEWVDWFLGHDGERAYGAAMLDRGEEPADRYIGAESMPVLTARLEKAATALRRLRGLQGIDASPPEHVIATEAALEAIANFDAALVHERFYTVRGDCPCRVCRERRT